MKQIYFSYFGRALEVGKRSVSRCSVTCCLGLIMLCLTQSALGQLRANVDTLSVVMSPGQPNNTQYFYLSNSSGTDPVTISAYSELDVYSVGAITSFAKPAFGSWELPENQDRIANNVWLTRDDTKGVFNAYSETSASSGSPAGTSWTRGFSDDLQGSTYTSFNQMHGNNPKSLIGDTAILKLDTKSGSAYHAFFFSEWSDGPNGASFAYTRGELQSKYKLDAPYVGMVQPYGYTMVRVNFSSLGLTSGTHYGRVVIHTDHPDTPEVTVILKLKVTTPKIAISPSAIHVEMNDTTNLVQRTFSVANIGGQPLSWYTYSNLQNFCASISSTSGYLYPGDTGTYTVTFEGCYDGYHEFPLEIRSNDPQNPLIVFPLSVDKDGVPEVSVDTLTFTDTYVESTSMSQLMIEASGTADLEILSISSDNAVFLPGKTSFTIPAGQTHAVPVRFTPDAAGEHLANLLVVSNAVNEDSVYVQVKANSTGAPVMEVSSSGLSFALEHGASSHDSVAITNTGASNLRWESTARATVSYGKTPFNKADYADSSVPENRDALTENVSLARNNSQGLYDYNRNEIRFALGSAADLQVSDYQTDFRRAVQYDANELPGKVLSVYVPGENRFFDLHMESWTCCDKGGGFAYTRYEVVNWLAPVVQDLGPVTSFAKTSNADVTMPENQDSLSQTVALVRQSGGFYNIHETSTYSANSTTVKWALGTSRDAMPGDYSADFNQVLNQAGGNLYNKIVAVYLIEEDRYFDLHFKTYESFFSNGYSYDRYEYTPNLIEPGATAYAVFQASGAMPAGSYESTVNIQSNDPITSSVEIPVNISMTGTPDISQAITTYDFGSLVIGSSKSFSLPIRNAGSDVLEVTGLVMDDTTLVAGGGQVFQIRAGETYRLPLTYTADAVGTVSVNLTVQSNDPVISEHVIAVTGEVLDLPRFVVSDQVIYDTLQFGTASQKTFEIRNTGPGTLQWEVGYDVHFEKADYADFNSLEAQDRISDNVWLTRADNRGLFNLLETDTWSDEMSSFKFGNGSSTYVSTEYGDFRDYYRGYDLENGSSMSIHLVEDDSYYDFKFVKWTSDGNGGGFAYKRRAAAKWLGLDAFNGTMGTDSIASITVNYSALATNAGDHELTYTLLSNDPENPTHTITFYLHVDGEPEIVADLSPINVGRYKEKRANVTTSSINLQNVGGADLQVNLSVDNEAFSFETASAIIPGGGTLEVPVIFTPQEAIEYTGVISINSNDADESLLTIDVTGTGFVAPILALDKYAVADTVLRGGRRVQPITVSNIGGDTLRWQLWEGSISKADNADWQLAENQVALTEKVIISRRNNYELVNLHPSNAAIRWALGSATDLNPENYNYWYTVINAVGGEKNLEGKIVSLYSMSEERYFDLYISQWTPNNSGGFSFYYRENDAGTSGMLTSGQSEIANIPINGFGLDAGVHQRQIFITSGEMSDIDTVNVAVSILGEPALFVSADSLTFGPVATNGEAYMNLVISNTGSASGALSLSLDNAAFFIDQDTLVVAPGAQEVITVGFHPVDLVDYRGTISFTTDDEANPSFDVLVSGSGAVPPTLVVSQPILEASLFYGETLTKEVVITNNGALDLVWSFALSGEEVYFEKTDNADWTLEINQDHISEFVALTRQDERGIFNILQEEFYDRNSRISPAGTQWGAIPSHMMLMQDYSRWSYISSPNDLPGKTVSMHDIAADQFYDFSWEKWTSDSRGGGFAYSRKPAMGPEYKAVKFSSQHGVVAPGATTTVTIEFNPNLDYDGEFALPIVLETNDPEHAQTSMALAVEVKGILVVNEITDQLVNEGFTSQTIDITGVFADAQGDELTYMVTSSDEAIVQPSILGGSLILDEVGFGSATITLSASDGKGNAASTDFMFRVNALPDVEPIANQVFDRQFVSTTLDLASFFSDPEAEELSFEVTSSSEGVVTVSLNGSELLVEEVGAGTATIEITATDLSGGSATQSFDFTVELLEQIITFDGSYGKTYGEVAFELIATASSGLPVTFASSDESVVSIAENTVTIVGAGSVIITASQPGDDVYAPATDINKAVDVAKAALTVTADDAEMIYGGAEPLYTYHYSGFIGSDSQTDIDTEPTTITVSTSVGDVGSYSLQVAQDGLDDDYTFVYVDGTLTVNPAALTITADDQVKTYGEENPTLTVTYSGFVAGDTENNLLAVPTVTTTADIMSGAGTYPISVSGAESGNYEITYSSGMLTVGKAMLTVSAEDVSKVYGQINPTLPVSYTGLVNGDDESVLSSAAVAETNAVATSGAGVYAITVSGGSAANYTVDYVDAKLTVNPASLTITADDQVKTYGEENPTLTVTYSGFVAGDTESNLLAVPTVTTTADKMSGVGTYSISASGAASDNYEITYASGILTVGKAMLTVSADNASKIYGQANPTLPVSYTGLVNGDDESVLSSAAVAVTNAVATSGVGVYAISVTGGSAANYTVDYVDAELTVNPASLTITAEDQVKTYGEENPPLTVTYSGFVAGDTQSDLVAVPAVTTTADMMSGAGTYPISVSAAESDNYEITYTGGMLTIDKAMLTVSADDASKIYGQANPALTVSYSGFVGSDNASVLLTAPVTGTDAVATSGVGAYAINVSGGSAANYTFGYANGMLTVNPAALTITADDQVKTYGEENPALTVTYSGFVAGDNQSDLVAEPTVTTTADMMSGAGTYPISVSGAASDNYEITYATGVLTIDKVMLMVSADDASKIYGEANPAMTVSYLGFVGSDDASVLLSAPVTATDAVATSGVGAYAITVSGGSAANYTFGYENGMLTVTPAALTITADDQVKTYGEENPPLTVTYSGFVAGDTQSDLVAEPIIMTTANVMSELGTYPISATGAASDNYEITYASGILTVGKAILTVSAEDVSRIYGQANPALSVSYTGLVNGDDESVLSSATVAVTNAVATSSVGAYAINVSGGSAANYTVDYVDGVLTVNPATLTITADDQVKTYGEENPTLTVTYSGFVGADDASVLSAVPVVTTEAVAISNVGEYAIIVSAGEAENYLFTYMAGSLTITQATASITIADLEQVADGTAKKPTITTSPEGLEYVATYNGSSEAPVEAGSYEVVVEINDQNYKGTTTATFVLAEAPPLSIEMAYLIKVYPNPGDEYVTVESAVDANVEVYDLKGVLQMKGKTNEVLDVRKLNSGAYLFITGKQVIRFIKR